LNTEEVVVRAIGSDLRMDYTAVGQTTHLAARIASCCCHMSSSATCSSSREAYKISSASLSVPCHYAVEASASACWSVSIWCRRSLGAMCCCLSQEDKMSMEERIMLCPVIPKVGIAPHVLVKDCKITVWRTCMDSLSRIWTSCHNSLRRYTPFKKNPPHIYEVCSAADRIHILCL
jgi:hypothetical protein